MLNNLTVKQAAERLGITPRAVQIRCKDSGIDKKGKTYLIPVTVVERWESETDNEAVTENEAKRNEGKKTDSIDDQETITEEFSPEQYEKLQEVIYKYPELLERIQDYKNEIEYLRKSLDKKGEQMDKLIDSINGSIRSIQQQNFLKAKEKGYDTEEPK